MLIWYSKAEWSKLMARFGKKPWIGFQNADIKDFFLLQHVFFLLAAGGLASACDWRRVCPGRWEIEQQKMKKKTR